MTVWRDRLARAWLWLLGLSAASTLLAELVGAGFDPRLTGSIVLALALMKARIILAQYLGLADAPRWKTGFILSLSLFCLLLLGLYLVPLAL